MFVQGITLAGAWKLAFLHNSLIKHWGKFNNPIELLELLHKMLLNVSAFSTITLVGIS